MPNSATGLGGGLLQKVARATYALAPTWMPHEHEQPAPLTDPPAA